MSQVNLGLSEVLSLMGYNGARVDAILDNAGLLSSEKPLDTSAMQRLGEAIDSMEASLPKIGDVDSFGECYTPDDYISDRAHLHNLRMDIRRIRDRLGIE